MSDYILGTHDAELARLQLQHALWRPAAQAAWRRAGLGPGQRVLELGAGPGLAALELARAVGPAGRVLGLELSPAYVAAGQALAKREGLEQLGLRRHDLRTDPLPTEGFDLLWCRWVAMFLPELEPLLDQLAPALRPGGTVLFHEYLHWDTFGLHPHGAAIRRFGQAAQRSFREAGGDPDVNRRLPALLAQRGFQIQELRPLPVLGQTGSMAAQWMGSFVAVYGEQLQRLGLWSAADATQAAAEVSEAQRDAGSYWMGPTLLELRATK